MIEGRNVKQVPRSVLEEVIISYAPPASSQVKQLDNNTIQLVGDPQASQPVAETPSKIVERKREPRSVSGARSFAKTDMNSRSKKLNDLSAQAEVKNE